MDGNVSAEHAKNWCLLNCSLLYGVLQETVGLGFSLRRRLAERSHSLWAAFAGSEKSPADIWRAACISGEHVVGRARLLAAAQVITKRGHAGNFGRAFLQAKALKQFKAEKGRAVSAGMAPNDFPLLATWCESLWNHMTDEQKQQCIDGSPGTLLPLIGHMIRA